MLSFASTSLPESTGVYWASLLRSCGTLNFAATRSVGGERAIGAGRYLGIFFSFAAAGFHTLLRDILMPHEQHLWVVSLCALALHNARTADCRSRHEHGKTVWRVIEAQRHLWLFTRQHHQVQKHNSSSTETGMGGEQ